MKKHFLLFLIMGGFLINAAYASGAGFHVREQGAKATGMANAFAAQADDPSAIFYNPAGLAFQEGTQYSLGVTYISLSKTKFKGTTEIGGSTVAVKDKTRGGTAIPPNFYAFTTLESMPLSLGIGLNLAYPLTIKWDTNSPLRDEIKEISILPMNINPTIAYQIEPLKLAVAFGIDYSEGSVWVDKIAYTPAFMGNLELGNIEIEADGEGWGYNAGILYKPIDSLSFGLAYRSEIKLELSGNADFLSTNGSVTGLASASSDVSSDVTLPECWSFGIMVKPMDKLTLECDVDYFGWSSFHTLKFNFKGVLDAYGFDTVQLKDWHDSWTYRIGAQYAVTDNFDLRCGYVYDETPIPSSTLGPELPGADRHNIALGLGYHKDRGAIDIGYLLAIFDKRKVDNLHQAGEYSGNRIHILGMNVTYAF